MKSHYVALVSAVFAAVLMAGCGNAETAHSSREFFDYVIKWTGGPTVAESTFYFNEVLCGTGKGGFEQWLKLLDTVPEDTLVRLEFPPRMRAYYEDTYSDSTTLPFREQDSEAKLWNAVAGKLIFVIQFADEESPARDPHK